MLSELLLTTFLTTAALDSTNYYSSLWDNHDISTKQEYLMDVYLALTTDMHLENVPTLIFAPIGNGVIGRYNLTENRIIIDMENYDDPFNLIATIAHEVKHVEQYQSGLYTKYFQEYVSFIENPEKYETQFLEQEAEVFAFEIQCIVYDIPLS